jgi:hypothetical protein
MRNKGEQMIFRSLTRFTQKKRKTPTLHQAMWLRVLDGISIITHGQVDQKVMGAERAKNMRIRLDGISRAIYGLNKEIELLTEVRKEELLAGVKKEELLAEARKEKEEALGPFLYEITTSNLFELSPTRRSFVVNCGTPYFNDIYPVAILKSSVPGNGPSEADVDWIMKWKRDCVSRITQKQVDEALDTHLLIPEGR